MTQSVFQVPPDGELYASTIKERCEDLIQQDIWRGLDMSRLRRWLSNFRDPVETYFAACILDALTYRSEDQVVSFLWQIVDRILPDLTRRHPTPRGPILDWGPIISGADEPYLRFVSVTRTSDPPGKSSEIILRLMRRRLHVNEKWITQPWNLSRCLQRGIKTFIFVDDFLGTGEQFVEVVRSSNLEHALNNGYVVYAPIVAHEVGIKRVTGAFPQLHLSPVEILSEESGIFSPSSPYFDDRVNTPAMAQQFYYRLLKDRKIDLAGSERRGYGALDVAYAFSHAAPDNSLPILWWPHSKNWFPLFER